MAQYQINLQRIWSVFLAALLAGLGAINFNGITQDLNSYLVAGAIAVTAAVLAAIYEFLKQLNGGTSPTAVLMAAVTPAP